MTLTETFDLLDIAPGDLADIEGDHLDAIKIVIGDAISDDAPDDDARPEPSLASTPFFIEFDEPVRLDPERAGLAWELSPAVAEWAIRLRSPLASLAFHLLPAAAIVVFPLLMVEPPAPIPVQLVFEAPPPPPPPPPPQPEPQRQPPPPKFETGRLASVDMGVVKPIDNLGRSVDPVPKPSAGEQQPDPSESKAPPPPVPAPKPAPPKPHPATFQMSKPSGANVPQHEEVAHEAQRSARLAGLPATRDEYFAYLVELTRQHIDLLPRPLASQLHGETDLSIQVQDNGTVLRIAIIRSCGNPELDERVVMMVRAVGRFPPLPQWFQGEVMDMDFRVAFPLVNQ